MALIRSWNTATLIVKNGAFTRTEIARLKAFASRVPSISPVTPGSASKRPTSTTFSTDHTSLRRPRRCSGRMPRTISRPTSSRSSPRPMIGRSSMIFSNGVFSPSALRSARKVRPPARHGIPDPRRDAGTGCGALAPADTGAAGAGQARSAAWLQRPVSAATFALGLGFLFIEIALSSALSSFSGIRSTPWRSCWPGF